MPYSADSDPYLDPDSGVLRNSLGITNEAELEKAEADITIGLIASLPERPISGSFDLIHLRDLHWELFGTIYPWAGEQRTVEMAKGTTRFANADFLQQAAEDLFTELHNEKLLNDLSGEAYITRLAHYYSEVNTLHPFREGNGRTQRAFFTLLALESSRRIAWEYMNPKENLEASIAGYKGDESKLFEMLSALVRTASQ